jgi:hypothetical protein
VRELVSFAIRRQEGLRMEEQLRRQACEIRRLKVGLASLALVVAVLTVGKLPLGEVAADPKKPTFDEIDVRRLNVVDPKGGRRIALAYDAPPGVWRGKPVPCAAGAGAATILFYADRGDEVGGLLFGRNAGGQGEVLSLDYSHLPIDGAKIGLFEEAKGGGAFVLLKAAPPAGLALDVGKMLEEAKAGESGPNLKTYLAHNHDRISLTTAGRDAAVVLADTQGRKRIVVVVDKNDQARIEVLDAEGKVVARLPEK